MKRNYILLIALLIVWISNCNCQETIIPDYDKFNNLVLKSDYKEALQLSEQNLEKQPEQAIAHYQHALINRLLYRQHDALVSIKKAVELDPENIDYLTEYATISLVMGYEKKALELFSVIFDKQPDHLYAGINKGKILIGKKKYADAFIVYDKLADADETNNYFERQKGYCKIQLLEFKAAIPFLERALQLDSTDLTSYEYLAKLYKTAKKFDLALEYLNTAKRFHPNSWEVYMWIGDVHVIRNHNYQAIKPYKKAYELNPDEAILIRLVAESYKKIKRYDEAKKYFHETLLHMKDSKLCSDLGDCYKHTGNQDSSLYFYDQALVLLQGENASIFSVNKKMAEIYFHQKNYDKSLYHYKKALELELKEGLGVQSRNAVIIDVASIYKDIFNDNKKAISYFELVEESSGMFNFPRQYKYAQDQIKKIREEMFFKGEI